jgi:hypothetical protein
LTFFLKGKGVGEKGWYYEESERGTQNESRLR